MRSQVQTKILMRVLVLLFAMNTVLAIVVGMALNRAVCGSDKCPSYYNAADGRSYDINFIYTAVATFALAFVITVARIFVKHNLHPRLYGVFSFAVFIGVALDLGAFTTKLPSGQAQG